MPYSNPIKESPSHQPFSKLQLKKCKTLGFNLFTINIYIINIYTILSMDLFFIKSMYNGCWKVEVYIQKMKICAS